MMHTTRRLLFTGTGALALALAASPVLAQKTYDEGATDTEIKIGHTNPYSGNASAYGTIGKVIDAYFKMINEQGGINGRKINFISYDDGYAPPKTVEMVRKLVEEEKVLFVFQTPGPWAISPTTSPRPSSTPSTSWPMSRSPRSAFSCRTTTTVRITSTASS